MITATDLSYRCGETIFGERDVEVGARSKAVGTASPTCHPGNDRRKVIT